MTQEECQKAVVEGTWLVWTDAAQIAWIVKIVGYSMHNKKTFWHAHEQNGGKFAPLPEELRIATPNDMLKYGE